MLLRAALAAFFEANPELSDQYTRPRRATEPADTDEVDLRRADDHTEM